MKQRIYVGTYSQKEPASRGIYLYEFDTESGVLSLIDSFQRRSVIPDDLGGWAFPVRRQRDERVRGSDGGRRNMPMPSMRPAGWRS